MSKKKRKKKLKHPHEDWSFAKEGEIISIDTIYERTARMYMDYLVIQGPPLFPSKPKNNPTIPVPAIYSKENEE